MTETLKDGVVPWAFHVVAMTDGPTAGPMDKTTAHEKAAQKVAKTVASCWGSKSVGLTVVTSSDQSVCSMAVGWAARTGNTWERRATVSAQNSAAKVDTSAVHSAVSKGGTKVS